MKKKKKKTLMLAHLQSWTTLHLTLAQPVTVIVHDVYTLLVKDVPLFKEKEETVK